MSVKIENDIAIVMAKGSIDSTGASAIFTDKVLEQLLAASFKLLLISLEEVSVVNQNGLTELMKRFRFVNHKKKNLSFGFCDIDVEKFHVLLGFKKRLKFSIFKNEAVALLFLQKASDEAPVLVWSESSARRNALAFSLKQKGYITVVAQNKEEFEAKQNDDFKEVVHLTSLEDEQDVGVQVEGVEQQENAIIYQPNGFLDAGFEESFDKKFFAQVIQDGYNLFVFDMEHVTALNAHGVNFLVNLSKQIRHAKGRLVLAATRSGINFNVIESLKEGGIIFLGSVQEALSHPKLKPFLKHSKAQTKGLNKALVRELPNFVNATVDTIESMTSASAKKRGANVQLLTLTTERDYVASSLSFGGDFNAIVILIFSRALAKKSCELLLGEDMEEEEMVYDVLGEFVNIIGGKVKAQFSDAGHKVSMSLPRTIKDIPALVEEFKDSQGVLVDLTFDEEEFFFFLTV